MSTTVDERVVSMQFDNAEFEKNVKTSMSTIDKLKKKLKFSDSSESFEEVEKASKRLKFDGVNEALEKTQIKFNGWAIVAKTAIERVVNKAIDAGEKLVKSLSVDNVAAGWQKYAEETSAVQTMMAAITADANGKAFESDEAKLEYINEQLDKMTKFTDETSYNFTAMSNTVGKFVSNGVGLEKAVSAMQGIATWAAVSGQNAQVATNVMTQLAQALGSGTVKLQDWMSVETANMATAEFKEMVLATASSVGTLIEENGKFYINLAKTNKELEEGANGLKTYKDGLDGTAKSTNEAIKGAEVNANNFRSMLQEGFFTTDVLTDTLKEYGDFSDKLVTIMTKDEDVLASDLIELADIAAANREAGDSFDIRATKEFQEVLKGTNIEAEDLADAISELGSEQFDLGRKAFKAAQEAKTFDDAITATKEAAATKWSGIFKIIFGDYLEAKELWTTLSEDLYEIFVGPLGSLTELFKDWKSKGGYKLLFDVGDDATSVYTNLRDTVMSILDSITTAWHEVFGGNDVEDGKNKLVKFTEKLFIFTSQLKETLENSEGVKTVFKAIFNIFKGVKTIIAGIYKIVKPIANLVIQIIARVINHAADFINLFTSAEEKGKKLSKVTEKLGEITSSVSKSASKSLTKFGDKIKNALDKPISSAKENVSLITNELKKFGKKLTESDIEQALDTVESIATTTLEIIALLLKNILEALDAILKTVKQLLESINVTSVYKKIASYLKIITDGIKEVFSTIDEPAKEALANAFTTLATVLKGALKALNSFFKLIKDAAEFLMDLPKYIKIMAEYIKDFVNSLDMLPNIFSKIKEKIDSIDWSDKINDVVSLSAVIISFIATLSLVATILKAIKLLNKFTRIVLWAADALDTVATGVFRFMTGIKNAALIVAFAASILILVHAFEKMYELFQNAKSPMDLIAPALAILGAMLVLSAAVYLVSFALEHNKGKIAEIGIAFAGIAASLFLICEILKKLNELALTVTWGNILSLLAMIGTIGLTIAVIAAASSKIPKAATNFVGIALAFVGVSLSCFILINVLKKLDSEFSDDLWDPIFKLMAMIGVVAVSIGVTALMARKSGIKIAGIAISFVAIVASCYMIVDLLDKFKDKYVDDYWDAIGLLLGSIGGICLMIGMTALIARKSGVKMAGIGLAVLAIAGSMHLILNVMERLSESKIFSSIESTDNVISGLIAIGAVMVAILGMMALVVRAGSKNPKTSKAILATGITFAIISASLFVIIEAIKSILKVAKDLPEDMSGVYTLFGGMVILLGAIGTLIAVITKVANGKPMAVFAAGTMITLVIASLFLIVTAISSLTRYKWDSLITPFIGLTVLVTAIGIFLTLVTKEINEGEAKSAIVAATMLVLMTLSILPLAYVITKLAGYSWDRLITPFLGLAILFTGVGVMFAVIAKLSDKYDIYKLVNAVGAFVVMIASLLAIAGAIKMLAKVPYENLIGSMISFVALVVVLGLVLTLLGAAVEKVGALRIGVAAGAFLAMSASLMVIAAAIKMFEGVSLAIAASAAIVILALAISLAVLGNVNALGVIAASGALIMAAAAILVVAEALQVMSGLSKDDIKKFAMVLAVVSAVLVVLGALSAFAIAGSAALVLFATSIILLGGAFVVASLGFNLFSIAVERLYPIVDSIATIFTNMATGIIQSLVIITNGILENKDKMRNALVVLFTTLGLAIGESVMTLIRFVGENLGELATIVVNAVLAVLTALESRTAEIVERLVAILIKIVVGIANALDEHGDELIDAVKRLIEKIFVLLLKFFGFSDEEANSIIGKVGEMLNSIMSTLIGWFKSAIAFIKKWFTGAAGFYSKLAEWFKGVVDKVIGLKDDIVYWFKTLPERIKQIGRDLIDGFKKGIDEKWTAVKDWFNKTGEWIAKTWKDLWKIGSPSRLFRDYGRFLDEGLVLGLRDEENHIYSAMTDIGETATDSLSNALSQASALIESDVDMQPTIRPVLDLTEIQNGTSSLSSMMDNVDGFFVSGSARLANATASSMNSARGTGMTSPVTNNDNSNSFSNVFNISGDDPEAIAQEVSRIIQEQVGRRNMVWDR